MNLTKHVRGLHAILILTVVLPGPQSIGQQVDLGTAVRQYQVVPCLLPARVRKLGNMTYPERRRLVETSAMECELKGGEYTYYDRAAPDSAAAFFRKLADEGNVDAQVKLGDVYQYLYSEPDYEQARSWYQTAADNGSAAGQMRLALLYERGQGVPRDGLLATNLWREATGAGEELVRASELAAAQTRADARIAELTQALQERSEEAEQIRSELTRARREIDGRRQALAAAEAELARARENLEERLQAAPDDAEVTALRDQVAEQQRQLKQQRYEIDSLEANVGVQQAQLTASLRQAELENDRLTQELERVTARSDAELQAILARSEEKDRQIAELDSRLASAQADLERASAGHAALIAALEEEKRTAADSQSDRAGRIAELEAARAERQAELAAQRSSVDTLRAELASATEESRALQAQLDSQIHETEAARAQFARAEAELQRTRLEMAGAQSELANAQAELSRLEQDRDRLARRAGEQSSPDSAEMRTLLAAQEQRAAQQQALIDNLEGTVARFRDQLEEINLRRTSYYAMRTPIEDTSNIRLPSDVKLGRYFSLVIGNNDYEHLNDLENAANDASAVDRVLREEYGFESKLLINATEKQIYQAFVELQKKTSENDLVMIYYAGHGYEIKNESYWLPVEVQSRQEAEVSGISSLKVADWVRAMSAKHVMIIADSCYSGSGIETTGGFRYSVQDLEEMLPFLMKNRSRTMLTSGTVSPVLDGDGSGGEFSLFTRELIGLLRENRGVLYGEALYDHLVERVKYTPDGTAVNQTPMFGSIESAGHECGQFVLVHPSLRT